MEALSEVILLAKLEEPFHLELKIFLPSMIRPRLRKGKHASIHRSVQAAFFILVHRCETRSRLFIAVKEYKLIQDWQSESRLTKKEKKGKGRPAVCQAGRTGPEDSCEPGGDVVPPKAEELQ